MPPLNTHLVIGERVFAEMPALNADVYGDFLLGCLLVDVNNFVGIDRRITHFAGRSNGNGSDAFTKSCTNFLDQLDDLLLRPWGALTASEKAFVAGYFCHLAADEPWKAWGIEMRQILKLASLKDLPVPGGVILTASSVLSNPMYSNFTAINSALINSDVPDVFTHITQAQFRAMWTIVQKPLADPSTPEAYFTMLKRAGKSEAELNRIREEHATYWEAAIALVEQFGGVEPFIDKAVVRATEMLPHLSLNGDT
jgi:hypothetical protein